MVVRVCENAISLGVRRLCARDYEFDSSCAHCDLQSASEQDYFFHSAIRAVFVIRIVQAGCAFFLIWAAGGC